MQLAWVYGMNGVPALRRLVQRDCLDIMTDRLPHVVILRPLLAQVRSYIEERVSSEHPTQMHGNPSWVDPSSLDDLWCVRSLLSCIDRSSVSRVRAPGLDDGVYPRAMLLSEGSVSRPLICISVALLRQLRCSTLGVTQAVRVARQPIP